MMYLWQLPQNLLGLIFLLFLQGEEKRTFNNITFYYAKGFKGGVSLGNYIILGYIRRDSIKHEYGHCIQSKYLGWLYLLIIGLPSLLHALFYKGDDYYNFWTEKWANKLGKVK